MESVSLNGFIDVENVFSIFKLYDTFVSVICYLNDSLLFIT